MIPLYRDPCFTFRFAENRIIRGFRLEGVESGRHVSVIKIQPHTGEHLKSLATAMVGESGWVDLAQPLLVRAGDAFIAMAILVRRETKADYDAVRRMNRLAFEHDAEARLVDALRAGGFGRVSMVAEVNGQVVGHILFSELSIVIAVGTVPALALAPMAVLPTYQRRGIGSILVRQGLEACKQDGHRIAVVLGHPDFYPRFGFSAKLAEPLGSPFGSGSCHMAIELASGALDGVSGMLVYSAPFDGL